MSGLEHDIETDVVEQAGRHGWRSYKVCFIGTRGGSDRMFGKEGRCVVIEFKRPGKVPTTQQERRHKELRDDFGFEVWWADDQAGACSVLGVPWP